MKKIAIIGSGISGLTCAYLLNKNHQVTVFEKNDYLGGHTATIDVEIDNKPFSVDTGFIVFNDRNYPNFNKILDRLGVKSQKTEMSFSVQHTGTGIEYNGHNFLSLFSQKKNWFSLKFYRFIYDIVRFNRLNKKLLANNGFADIKTVGDFLKTYQFSNFFAEHYILPMVAAIWSASIKDSKDFPYPLFLQFFNNHGLLNLSDRPQWYVIKGGSKSYIPSLTKNIKDIRLNAPVASITRQKDGVTITSNGIKEQFDDIIFACHSDQALALINDKTAHEQQILGDIEYRENEVTLHTDRNILPIHKASWASWNFWNDAKPENAPVVTYYMNTLQGIQSEQAICVTLNRGDAIEPNKVIKTFNYAHPVYNNKTAHAQTRRSEINGSNHSYFCGAYWYNGFHEDGVRSALDVCELFGEAL